MDKEVLLAMLQNYKKQVEDTENALPDTYARIDTLYGGDTQKFVDDIYAHTAFTSEDSLLVLLQKEPDKIMADPMMAITLEMYLKLMDLRMKNREESFDIEENDSVTTHHGEDSVTVAKLAPNQHLKIHREWDGLYREELIVHGWQYISSIKIGETKVDSTMWNNEAAWHHRTKGGGRFAKEESHYYDLWFKD